MDMNMGSGMFVASSPIQGANISFYSDHNISVGNTAGVWQIWDGEKWIDSNIWINPYDTQTAPNTYPQTGTIQPLPWNTDPIPAIMPSPLTPEQMSELVAEAFRKLKEMPPEERRQLEEANRKANPSKDRKKPRRMIQI